MSGKKPIDLRQDRRQWIATSAGLLGASLLPLPSVSGVAAQVPTPPVVPHADHPEAKQAPTHFFTPAQHALVDELTEAIIPADTHSGGAKAAKVADYIDQLLLTSVDDEQKSLWRDGLRLIDALSHHDHGKSFVDSTPAQRIAVLKVLSDNDHMTDLPEVRLFNELKSVTVFAYYTSKIGIHDELQYKGNRILLNFVGCGDPTPPST
jgi:Gluconate 2-dehydrogenase subunit 3